MSAQAVATGVAVLFGYMIHYAFHLLAIKGRNNLKVEDIEERAKKLYLFGFLGVLSVHFTTSYGALFCWLTLFTLIPYYGSALNENELSKRKWFVTGGMLYSLLLTFWWIGQTAIIFKNVKVLP
jgi:hypothetical protein